MTDSLADIPPPKPPKAKWRIRLNPPDGVWPGDSYIVERKFLGIWWRTSSHIQLSRAQDMLAYNIQQEKRKQGKAKVLFQYTADGELISDKSSEATPEHGPERK